MLKLLALETSIREGWSRCKRLLLFFTHRSTYSQPSLSSRIHLCFYNKKVVSLKALCSVLAFQALAVSAAPAEELPKFIPPNKLLAQASIYYCSNIRWNGECRSVGVPLDKCYNVPKAWNGRISYIKNQAKGSYRCTWYIGYNCNGKSYSNQEDATLADGDGAFNDSISSYSCRRM